MNNTQINSNGLLDVTEAELKTFFSIKDNPEGLTKSVLVFVGLLLTPVTLFGALWFYIRGYNRFMGPKEEYPRLSNLRPIVKIGMVVGSILTWVLLYFTSKLMVSLIEVIGGKNLRHQGYLVPLIFILNIVLTAVFLFYFNKWRGVVTKFIAESRRHGTARFAKLEELAPYRQAKGFYIGNGMYYSKSGHILTAAGTRAGKSTNLIFQNLLIPKLFDGSWVIVDPKGELAAVSARVQRNAGRKVVLLNPWDLLSLGNTAYNPLDILKSSKNISDDVQMIAEAIIPTTAGGDQDHFDNRARAFVSGLLLHLVTAENIKERTLENLWKWFRLDSEEWIRLLADMSLNNDPNAGDIVKACANEIVGLMKSSEREYGSVISSAQKYTDFLKSPALRESMIQSDKFTSADLASGNVTVYVIIPADRLKTHSQWLRLVVTSLMRAVIRDPQKDVCFLLDEFYALGYLSEIDVALGSYAGYGVHIWAILQNLGQLEKIYKDSWENFISSCSVRHFFNVSDNFTLDYLSKMFGQTSVIEYDEKGNVSGASGRPLVTIDELRRESGEIIYTVIDQLAPAQVPKVPYYAMGLDADPNPYFNPDGKKPQQTTAKQVQETATQSLKLPPMPQLPPGWKMKWKEPKP